MNKEMTADDTFKIEKTALEKTTTDYKTDKEALETAKILAEYCNERSCGRCVFLNVIGGCKLLQCNPSEWDDLLDILDKEEKEYLSSIIKPFRDRTITICKADTNTGYEYIKIVIELYVIKLPAFSKGAMYKGMKTERNYIPEELEL